MVQVSKASRAAHDAGYGVAKTTLQGPRSERIITVFVYDELSDKDVEEIQRAVMAAVPQAKIVKVHRAVVAMQ